MSERTIRPVSLPELTGPEPGQVVEPLASAPAHAVREGRRIAGAIVARATAQAGEILAAAREQGLDQGVRAAREAEGEALRNAAAALREAAQRLEAARREVQHQLAGGLPDLAIAVARQILGREFVLQPEALAAVVREAVTVVAPAARIALRLHPDDIACLERHRDLWAEAAGGAELRIEVAPEVGRGGCVVDSESLTLAAGLPQQLERALALLKDAP